MDTNRHRDRIAIVTGAGSGIGAATVLRLAGEGAIVIGCDVSPEGLTATEGLLKSAGLTATLTEADVTDQAAMDALVAAAGSRVDLLVNNAGIMDHFLPITEVDDATWERVLDINLTGVMRLTRAVLPLMVDQGSGSIVTVASEASLRGGGAGVAYTSSKHGVIGLVKHVAFFYGPKGIRSNAVLPGPVATGINSTASPQSEWAIERANLGFAVMTPPAESDTIATAISWLGSAEASNINGAILTADGGWSAA